MNVKCNRADIADEPHAHALERQWPSALQDEWSGTRSAILAAEAELRRYAGARLSRQDVEDIIQDAFVRLYSRDARKGPIANLTAFLRCTVRNLLFDRYRAPHFLEYVPDEEMRAFPDEAASPERIVLGRQAWQAVAGELARLPPSTLEMFLQHRFGAATCRELAQQYKLPRSTVHDQLRQVLERLSRAARPYLER